MVCLDNFDFIKGPLMNQSCNNNWAVRGETKAGTMKNPQRTQNTLMRLTSPFQNRNGKNQINCFLLFGTRTGITKIFSTFWDGNGNYQKAFPLFGTGTGNLKNLPTALFGNRNWRRSRWEIYRNGNSGSCLEGLLPVCLHCLVNSFNPVLNDKQKIEHCITHNLRKP